MKGKTMSEFIYYFLTNGSAKAIAKADELGMFPNSTYNTIITKRYPETHYPFTLLVVDRQDGHICNATPMFDYPTADSREEGAPPPHRQLIKTSQTSKP